jgi:hypothetical protein
MPVININSKNRLSKEWHIANNKLLNNVYKHPFISEYERSVYANIDGQKIYLPAYIPYLGANYFDYRPRVLCYAINQNLSPHVAWTKDWINIWVENLNIAYDRLNNAVKEKRSIPIKPYAEGFIPLVALIAILQWIEIYGGSLPKTIDEVIAVTNYIKFSTQKDASSSSIPEIWWRECGYHYVAYEIDVLKPDIILCFGKKTYNEVRRVLYSNNCLNDYGPLLLQCRFPARMASIKSRPLSKEELDLWNIIISPLISRIIEPLENSYHCRKIPKYSNYFIDIYTSFRSTI